MSPIIVEKLIGNDNILLGEGPHWDAETQTLYFVDIPAQNIHKYIPSLRKHTKASIGKSVTLIIPVQGKDDEFVITIDRELVLIKWDGESENVSILEKLYEVDVNTNNKFNDGKCDPSGRLWAGTLGGISTDSDNPVISKGKGSLFSFQNKKVTTHLTNVSLANGLAFDVDAKKFYYVDSYKGTLDQYDFDITNGTISNEKVLFTLTEEGRYMEKAFDGMTIDTQGNLWVAIFNGSKVVKIDPRKPETIAETIQIPAKQVTSVTFGGLNLDELYVTTGRIPGFGETPSSPHDGATYKVTGLNARGFPGVRIIL